MTDVSVTITVIDIGEAGKEAVAGEAVACNGVSSMSMYPSAYSRMQDVYHRMQPAYDHMQAAYDGKMQAARRLYASLVEPKLNAANHYWFECLLCHRARNWTGTVCRTTCTDTKHKLSLKYTHLKYTEIRHIICLRPNDYTILVVNQFPTIVYFTHRLEPGKIAVVKKSYFTNSIHVC